MNREDTQELLRLYNATDSGSRIIPCSSAHILDIDGNDILTTEVSVEMTSWDALYSILRANFSGIGNEYCSAPRPVEGESKNGRYDYGHRVLGIQEKDDHVEVEFQDLSGQTHGTTADLVIGADGPSSTVRTILLPDIERKYAGYVAWRGTVPESEASSKAKSTFLNTCCFYYGEDFQIISYTIPGARGALEPGQRLINWVWYVNYAEDSSELEELMTDVDGKRHRVSLPMGKMRPKILEKQRALAKRVLPPQFAEMVCKTVEPFLQCVTDVLATRNEFFNGKVLLVGDAVAGLRYAHPDECNPSTNIYPPPKERKYVTRLPPT
jgi:2-polyprenyl-6-methoxyphenol hydroxylase-like FAD-dependent oxidoreductase